MDTIKLAFKSLRYDTKKTHAFFLFQIFIGIAICICCHFCADRGIFMQNIPGYEYDVFIINGLFISQSFPPTTMFSLLLLFTLVMLGFYAFHFIYQEQSKKIAVFRISGVSTRKIILFLFIYLYPIILIAMIIGAFIGFVSMQIINFVIFSFSEVAYPGIQLSIEGIATTMIILFVQMIYYIILTLGFVHRNEIKEVLNYNNNGNYLSNIRIHQETKVFRIILTLIGIAIIIYFLLICINDLYTNLLLGSVAIGIGMKTLIKDIFINILEKIKRYKFYKKTNGYFGLSFAIVNLIRCYGLIFVLSVLYQFSICLIVFFKDNLVDFSISCILFFIASLAVIISIHFQILTDAKQKKKEYFELFRIGKTNDDIKQIINYNIFTFLIIILIVSNIFPSITFLRSLFDGIITIRLVSIVIIFYIIELIGLYFIVRKGYYNIVLEEN